MCRFFDWGLVRTVLRWSERFRPNWRKPFLHRETQTTLGVSEAGVYRVDCLPSSSPAPSLPPPWDRIAADVRPEPDLAGRIVVDALKGRAAAAALIVGGYQKREDFYLVTTRPNAARLRGA